MKKENRVFLTGDTHCAFRRIEEFCRDHNTAKEDIMIILGDSGINYYADLRDVRKKQFLAELPITLFCVHGNHEQRASLLPGYQEQEWNGGKVFVEKEYPNILFAKDGEIYDIGGMRTIVIGGAYSVDRNLRLAYGWEWYVSEQPDEEIKKYVEEKLEESEWKVDVVLTHTVPLKYQPTEVFLKGINQAYVDISTEEWLDQIENKLKYQYWYCGHFHTSKKVDRLQILFEDYEDFPEK